MPVRICSIELRRVAAGCLESIDRLVVYTTIPWTKLSCTRSTTGSFGVPCAWPVESATRSFHGKSGIERQVLDGKILNRYIGCRRILFC